ncbi:MAG: hypothetical protein ACI9OJ_001326 [Myxococcota bacterium]|jgi:hypothetical protein
MTKPNNPDDPTKPGPNEPEDLGLPEDIEATFRRWDSKRPQAGAESDSLNAFGDYPLTDEELALDHEIAQTPEQVLARARRAALYRLVLTSVLGIVGLIALFYNWPELDYLMQDESDQVDMGDLRKRWKKGERTFDERQSNTWARFNSGIMTEERGTPSNTSYYYDPMVQMIVVTPRALPEKGGGMQSMHSSFTELHSGRWIFPSDVSVGFSGQGRLMLADDAPRRYRNVIKLYRETLRLDSRLSAEQPLWLFLDEVAPSDQRIYLVIFGVVLLVLVVSTLFYWRARRRVVELTDAIAAGAR